MLARMEWRRSGTINAEEAELVRNFRAALSDGSFAPPGLVLSGGPTHGLRRGLHSCAPSELCAIATCSEEGAPESFTTEDTEGHRGCLDCGGVGWDGRLVWPDLVSWG